MLISVARFSRQTSDTSSRLLPTASPPGRPSRGRKRGRGLSRAQRPSSLLSSGRVTRRPLEATSSKQSPVVAQRSSASRVSTGFCPAERSFASLFLWPALLSPASIILSRVSRTRFRVTERKRSSPLLSRFFFFRTLTAVFLPAAVICYASCTAWRRHAGGGETASSRRFVGEVRGSSPFPSTPSTMLTSPHDAGHDGLRGKGGPALISPHRCRRNFFRRSLADPHPVWVDHAASSRCPPLSFSFSLGLGMFSCVDLRTVPGGPAAGGGRRPAALYPPPTECRWHDNLVRRERGHLASPHRTTKRQTAAVLRGTRTRRSGPL